MYVGMYIYIYIHTYIYIYIERERERGGADNHFNNLRPIFILRIVRPRIFESEFRNYCAKQLDGALRKSIAFV